MSYRPLSELESRAGEVAVAGKQNIARQGAVFSGLSSRQTGAPTGPRLRLNPPSNRSKAAAPTVPERLEDEAVWRGTTSPQVRLPVDAHVICSQRLDDRARSRLGNCDPSTAPLSR